MIIGLLTFCLTIALFIGIAMSSSDPILEVKSKVIQLGVSPTSSRLVDIRPPTGEIWIIHYIKVAIITGGEYGEAHIYVVDNTTGVSYPIKSNTGTGNPWVELNTEAEHYPICSNDVYYRLYAYNGATGGKFAYFIYVGKQIKPETGGLGVGGLYIPFDKLGLLAPYLALVSTIILAVSISVAYIKHRKKQ